MGQQNQGCSLREGETRWKGLSGAGRADWAGIWQTGHSISVTWQGLKQRISKLWEKALILTGQFSFSWKSELGNKCTHTTHTFMQKQKIDAVYIQLRNFSNIRPFWTFLILEMSRTVDFLSRILIHSRTAKDHFASLLWSPTIYCLVFLFFILRICCSLFSLPLSFLQLWCVTVVCFIISALLFVNTPVLHFLWQISVVMTVRKAVTVLMGNTSKSQSTFVCQCKSFENRIYV